MRRLPIWNDTRQLLGHLLMLSFANNRHLWASHETMRRAMCMLGVFLVGSVAFAGGLPRESYSGAIWGTIIGGLSGGRCHDRWSGRGAAIGAGVGFTLGTLAGEARRAEERRYHRLESAPAYGYSIPESMPCADKAAAAKTSPTSPSVWVGAPGSHRIPDAPRVPDAPTF